jgi:hypothetical protein
MFEKVRNKIDEMRRAEQQRRDECVRIAREKAEEEARKERERVRVEKDALLALNEKELLVEAIIAIRGLNTHLSNIEEQQNELIYRVDSLQSGLTSLEYSISNK